MWFVVTLKQGNKRPYIQKCERGEDEADTKVSRAEDSGMLAEKYHLPTDSIYEAKRMLRSRVASDFGPEIGNSNYVTE